MHIFEAYFSLYLGALVGIVIRPIYAICVWRKNRCRAREKNQKHNFNVLSFIKGVFITVVRFLKKTICLIWGSLRNIVCCLYSLIINMLQSVTTFFANAQRSIGIFFANIKANVRRKIQLLTQQLMKYKPIYLFGLAIKTYACSHTRILRRSICSVKEYCEMMGTRYVVIEEATSRGVYEPPFFEKSKGKVIEAVSPEIYVCEIKNIDVYGGCTALFSDKYCIYDALTRDRDDRLDIRFSNMICKLDNEILFWEKKSKKILGCAISLLGFASYNYYHLTVEILSRLAYIDSFLEYRDIPILVDSVVIEIPQFKDLLATVNVYNHAVIGVSESEALHVRKLIFPSYNTWMPINVRERDLIRPEDFMIADSALCNIRGSALKERKRIGGRKIFLTRKHSATTRLSNEREIVDLFRKYGFEIIATEEFSYQQQVELFNDACCVVGTSGAALTNVIYCRPETMVVCIIPREHKFYMYSTIAFLLGCKTIFLDAPIQDRSIFTAMDTFKLDIKYCERFLRSIGECPVKSNRRIGKRKKNRR